MALREFDDEHGRQWTVWEVHPTIAGRIRNGEVALRPEMAEGWLAFEAADGERRRLAPIPQVLDGWVNASLAQVWAWCALAQPVRRPRRLIE